VAFQQLTVSMRSRTTSGAHWQAPLKLRCGSYRRRQWRHTTTAPGARAAPAIAMVLLRAGDEPALAGTCDPSTARALLAAASCISNGELDGTVSLNAKPKQP
jgi:hypothetical protein